MKIDFIKGDLLKSNCRCICHQTNCQGAMGAGIARQIRDNYLIVYKEYLNLYYQTEDKKDLLGKFQPVKINDTQYIGNIFGQFNYGRSKGVVYTDYEALRNALKGLSLFMNQKNINEVAFPYLMGCINGGGDWEKVLQIIKEEFNNNDINIYFYQL